MKLNNDFEFLRQRKGISALQELRNMGFTLEHLDTMIQNPDRIKKLIDEYVMGFGSPADTIGWESIDKQEEL